MRGRHGSVAHCAHRRPNFTGDRSEARGHGAAHAALPPGSLRAGCACWCAPDGFAARKRRGGTQGAATPEGARGRGPPPAWGSLMGLLRPHRVVAPAARAPTDARGDHARPHPRILADNKKNKKQVKWLTSSTVKKNFQDFFIKKGFCFHSAKKDLRSTQQNFEYKCAPGSGAHDALKHVLVACRSWSREIKNWKQCLFFLKKKHTSTWDHQNFECILFVRVPYTQ